MICEFSGGCEFCPNRLASEEFSENYAAAESLATKQPDQTLTTEGLIGCSGPTAEEMDKTSGLETQLCHIKFRPAETTEVLFKSVKAHIAIRKKVPTFKHLDLAGVKQPDGSLYITF